MANQFLAKQFREALGEKLIEDLENTDSHIAKQYSKALAVEVTRQVARSLFHQQDLSPLLALIEEGRSIHIMISPNDDELRPVVVVSGVTKLPNQQ